MPETLDPEFNPALNSAKITLSPQPFTPKSYLGQPEPAFLYVLVISELWIRNPTGFRVKLYSNEGS